MLFELFGRDQIDRGHQVARLLPWQLADVARHARRAPPAPLAASAAVSAGLSTQVPIIGLVSRWTWSKRPPFESGADDPNQHGLHRPRVMTPGSGEAHGDSCATGFHNLLG